MESDTPSSQSLFQSRPFWWLFLLASGLAMAKISWRKWADVQVDFPLQLYIPWRLAEGEIMYRDFDYLFGPLSQYFHAGMFQVFGASLMTLAWVNLVLMGILVYLILILFRQIADTVTAGMCGLTFIGVFAFAHYMARGNNNFVTPYQYETTHGVLLALLGITLFSRLLNRPGKNTMLALGLLTGLVFLTKVEVFLAFSLALLIGSILSRLWKLVPGDLWRKHAVIFLLGVLAGPSAFVFYLSLNMPFDSILITLLRPYHFVFDSPLPFVPLYQYLTGFDDLGRSSFRIAKSMCGYAVFIALGLGIHRMISGDERRASVGLALFAVLFFPAVYIYFDRVPWFSLIAGLQLFLLVYCVAKIKKGFSLVKEQKMRPSFLVDLVFAVFSLIFLAKMILNVHLHNYGFVLAMPATLMFAKFWMHDLPQVGENIAKGPRFLKGYGLMLVGVFVSSLAMISAESYQVKSFEVGLGEDQIVDYDPRFHPRSVQFQEALEFLEGRVQPGDTMASIPNGLYFNYQLRVPTRLPSFTYFLWDDALNGKDAMRQGLIKNPPDWIVLVEMVYEGMGASYFGEDYSVSAYQWIRENYQPVFTSGHPPFTRTGLGVQVLKPK